MTRLPNQEGWKVTHPCHLASQLTLMFTWPIRPSRPTRWQFTQPTRPIRWKSCSPDHTISIDVNVTNPVNQMTRISTWPTKSLRKTRWNWCLPDHPGETVAHQTISWTMKFTLPEVHQTYQSNQVKLLYIWPYHQLWCSPDQPGPPGKADVHLTIPWIADNQQYTAIIYSH